MKTMVTVEHKKKKRGSAPWFVRHFPLIIGTVILTVVALIFFNFNFFSSNVRFSFEKENKDAKETLVSNLPQLEPNMLTIPSLGIEAPLVYITGTTENDFQKGLAGGVVHYPGTADVGNPGNSYFFGHSSDLPWSKGKYKTIFKDLPNIKEGDTIFVSDSTGTTFLYKAKRAFIVDPKETWVLDQYENKKIILSLQTSYPVGTAKQRFVVQAELVAE